MTLFTFSAPQLTTILRPLRPFSQVVVEKFQPDPLTARVATTFFRPAPARAIVQDCVLRGLRALRETEGLSVKMVIPGLGQPDASIPCYALALIILGLLFIALVLVWKRKTCFGVSSQTRCPFLLLLLQ
ncbi:taste receptor cell protein 1-like [Bos indicus x Bos taurus]|uniref:taste receptor cell protein 1-like n=1 Tax=Bos indicus x Bos taurus TaxID=30522 RepID=UPI0009526AEF|nr:PREDICTED: taste receptor cell protein 1-like [Bos indicus]XP_027377422.1 taste receptor cell protein 1-like [Bos indicus x Bos taurus]